MEEILEKKEEKNNQFETEKITKLIGKFSIPCVISLLVNALYNIVDQIFIGQGVGYLGNAATNVVFPITVISMAFSLLIGDGAAAYLSIKLGERKKDEASKGVGNAIIINIIVGVLFFIIGINMQSQLLNLFGVTEGIKPFATDYMKYIVIGLPFMMFTTTMNSIIRADGSPKFAMIAMLSGAILNTILDPIFIFVFKKGVEGAAIATITGQIISAIISLLYVKQFKSVNITRKTITLDVNTAKSVLSLGVSSFITEIAITIVIIVMNNTLKYYGGLSKYGSEIPLSATGIVMKVNQILVSIIVGIAVGAQPIIGFNFGAKNYNRVKQTYITAIKIITIITTIGFVIFEVFPQSIINIFGQEDGLYNEFALKCFRIFLMLCICNGFQISAGIFFQSIGKPIKSIIISISRQIIFFIPAVIILPRIFGITGALIAGPVADGLAFIVAMGFLYDQLKKLNKMDKEKINSYQS